GGFVGDRKLGCVRFDGNFLGVVGNRGPGRRGLRHRSSFFGGFFLHCRFFDRRFFDRELRRAGLCLVLLRGTSLGGSSRRRSIQKNGSVGAGCAGRRNRGAFFITLREFPVPRSFFRVIRFGVDPLQRAAAQRSLGKAARARV